mmetsp:Transcript_16492/g.35874  ORF Transcript_16492/g.35874 Transcript_16492/m.35874 type:complete len:253 (+) Transcript_16492:321-1079(+)
MTLASVSSGLWVGKTVCFHSSSATETTVVQVVSKVPRLQHSLVTVSRLKTMLAPPCGLTGSRYGSRLSRGQGLLRHRVTTHCQLSSPPLKVLRDSLRSGDDRELKRLIKTDPAKLDLKHGPGRSAAFEASECGHHYVLDVLLKTGEVNPDAQNGYGRTALMEAAKNGHANCIKILAKHKADLNVQNKNTWTAALYAATNGHAEALYALHEVGADLSLKMSDGSTPAILAAANGHLEAFAALIDIGVDLGAVC